MNPEQAWQSVLGQLQMEMPRASFDTWVRDTRPLSYANGILTVGVRNAYARDWLKIAWQARWIACWWEFSTRMPPWISRLCGRISSNRRKREP